MIPTQEKIDKMNAQSLLDISMEDLKRLESDRKEEIGRGLR